MTEQYDVIVVGAGTAGIPCAAAAAARGGRVLLVEQNEDVGGTLHLSAGQMSAAGTQLQKDRGIEDHPRLHFADAMRISKNTADPDLVNLAVNLAPDVIDWLMVEGFAMHPDCPMIFSRTAHQHQPRRPRSGRTISTGDRCRTARFGR